jgi:hypothetical protein
MLHGCGWHVCGIASAAAVRCLLQPCVCWQQGADFGQTLQVLLLGESGSTVFQGPPMLASPYFSLLHFVNKQSENPADFYLDIISGECELLPLLVVCCHFTSAVVKPSSTFEKPSCCSVCSCLRHGATIWRLMQ